MTNTIFGRATKRNGFMNVMNEVRTKDGKTLMYGKMKRVVSGDEKSGCEWCGGKYVDYSRRDLWPYCSPKCKKLAGD